MGKPMFLFRRSNCGRLICRSEYEALAKRLKRDQLSSLIVELDLGSGSMQTVSGQAVPQEKILVKNFQNHVVEELYFFRGGSMEMPPILHRYAGRISVYGRGGGSIPIRLSAEATNARCRDMKEVKNGLKTSV